MEPFKKKKKKKATHKMATLIPHFDIVTSNSSSYHSLKVDRILFCRNDLQSVSHIDHIDTNVWTNHIDKMMELSILETIIIAI